MNRLIFFIALWAVCFANDNQYCFDELKTYCDGTKLPDTDLVNCSAVYGGFVNKEIVHDVQKFTNAHIAASFDYLLLASNFGGYVKDRKGFEKLYRHLSDSTWEDSIDLIKYLTKRGVSMEFNRLYENTDYKKPATPSREIESLAYSLDTHKYLARKSFDIHKKASKNVDHEPEVASYLETNFLHKHAHIIRSLAGHISDVKQLTAKPGVDGVALFLFDEYLHEHSL